MFPVSTYCPTWLWIMSPSVSPRSSVGIVASSTYYFIDKYISYFTQRVPCACLHQWVHTYPPFNHNKMLYPVKLLLWQTSFSWFEVIQECFCLTTNVTGSLFEKLRNHSPKEPRVRLLCSAHTVSTLAICYQVVCRCLYVNSLPVQRELNQVFIQKEITTELNLGISAINQYFPTF